MRERELDRAPGPGIAGSLIVSLILGAGLAPGCSAPVRKYRCGPSSASPSLAAAEVWICHRDIMARAARGKRFTLREFAKAAEFFERVTGIPADLNLTAAGKLPGPGIERNLAEWDEWFRDNGHRLYWEPADRTVRVFETSEGSG